MNFPEHAPGSCNPSENSRRDYLVYLLLLSAHILLIWLIPFFPTQDGPSHLYNLLVLQDLLNGGKTWGNFFTHQVNAVPNLGFTIIGYPLLKIFTVLSVERIFLTIYVLLLGITVPALLKAFGKSPLPLGFLVFPAIFNFTLMMGFYSYNIAAALFLAAFCIAWAIRCKPVVIRAVCYNLAGLVVFFCHLIPFIFYLMSLYAMVVTEKDSLGKKCVNILKLSLVLSPSLSLLVWYFAQGNGGTPTAFPPTFSLSRFWELFINLMIFSSAPFSRLQLLPAAILMFVMLVGGYLALKDVLRRSKSGEITHSEKVLFLMVGALTIIYFVAPFRLGDGSYFNERFPWVIFLLSIPLLKNHPKASKRFTSLFLAGIAFAYFIFNSLVLWGQSSQVASFVKGIDAGCSRGDLVMSYKRVDSCGWAKVDVLFHAASYYGIFRECIDIGNYETAVPFFPVRFKKDLPPLPSQDQVSYEPEKIDFAQYPSIDFILGWQIDPKGRDRLMGEFDMIYSQENLTIWRRKFCYLRP